MGFGRSSCLLALAETPPANHCRSKGDEQMAHKLTIEVYGTKYSITANDDPSYVNSLGKELDKMAAELMKSGQLNINQALVLIALNCLDNYKKAEQSSDNLREQVAGYLEDAATARMELEEVQRELKKLKRELPSQTTL